MLPESVMGLPEQVQIEVGFSAAELAEFATTFERVKLQLPRLFASYWHRWSYIPGETPALIVYAEDGTVALYMVREDADLYCAIGITVLGDLQYWPARSTIVEAIRAAGLL